MSATCVIPECIHALKIRHSYCLVDLLKYVILLLHHNGCISISSLDLALVLLKDNRTS